MVAQVGAAWAYVVIAQVFQFSAWRWQLSLRGREGESLTTKQLVSARDFILILQHTL